MAFKPTATTKMKTKNERTASMKRIDQELKMALNGFYFIYILLYAI